MYLPGEEQEIKNKIRRNVVVSLVLLVLAVSVTCYVFFIMPRQSGIIKLDHLKGKLISSKIIRIPHLRDGAFFEDIIKHKDSMVVFSACFDIIILEAWRRPCPEDLNICQYGRKSVSVPGWKKNFFDVIGEIKQDEKTLYIKAGVNWLPIFIFDIICLLLSAVYYFNRDPSKFP